MPTWVVGAAWFRCHHLRIGAGDAGPLGNPSPSAPTAPNTGNPLSEAILWTAGSSHTTVTRLPRRAE